MNKSIVFGVPVVVFLLIFLPSISYGQYAQQQYAPPTIVISQPGARLLTIPFSTQELQQVERDPSFVLKKLGNVTARDCASSYRISDCIWSCKSKSSRKIKTCNPTLIRALERVWRR